MQFRSSFPMSELLFTVFLVGMVAFCIPLLIKRFLSDTRGTPFCTNGEVLVAFEFAIILVLIWIGDWYVQFQYYHAGEPVSFVAAYSVWLSTAKMSIFGSIVGLFLFPYRRGGSARRRA